MMVANYKYRSTASQLCDDFPEIDKYLEPFGYRYNLKARTIDDDVFEQANQMFETALNNYLSKKDLIYTFERAPNKINIDILL